MTDEPSAKGELLICNRCTRSYDPGDRFCRKCGAPLNNVPMMHEDFTPDVWRSPMPAIARSVAVIAAGTLAELAIRRAIRLVFRPSNFLPVPRRNSSAVTTTAPSNGNQADSLIEAEAYTVRRVRVRRRD
jgi:hypothetical protein